MGDFGNRSHVDEGDSHRGAPGSQSPNRERLRDQVDHGQMDFVSQAVGRLSSARYPWTRSALFEVFT